MNDKNALKLFYQQVGEKYPEEEEVYRTLRGRLRQRFVMGRLLTMSGSLLDVGCNRGMYLTAYQGGPRFGVDLSLPVLRKIDARAQIHRLQADAERLTCFSRASFDNVLCSEVLEHCLYPEKVIAGIAYVLKSGGRALITTPNYHGEKPGWIDLGSLEHFGVHSDHPAGYFHGAFSPEELAGFAQRFDLTVLESGTLEKEIKYAAKLPAALLYLGLWARKYLGWSGIERVCERFFNWLSLAVYYLCHFTGLEKIFLKWIREGVRSYIVIEKG